VSTSLGLGRRHQGSTASDGGCRGKARHTLPCGQGARRSLEPARPRLSVRSMRNDGPQGVNQRRKGREAADIEGHEPQEPARQAALVGSWSHALQLHAPDGGPVLSRRHNGRSTPGCAPLTSGTRCRGRPRPPCRETPNRRTPCR
jgi:hypothetical protein